MSEDRFLDGRLSIRQPDGGFRAGLDAVMLASAVPASGDCLELGTGPGAAALCVAVRARDVRVLGIEIDPALVAMAQANAAANGLLDRATFAAADALRLPAALRRQFDHVFCNPPFYAGGEASPVAAKARAKMDGGALADWLHGGLKRTRSGGTFTAIVAADRLGEAMAALPGRGLTIFPLWPKAGAPAKRIILQARLGANSPPVLAAGLVLHQDDGRFTPSADAILRGRAGLTV